MKDLIKRAREYIQNLPGMPEQLGGNHVTLYDPNAKISPHFKMYEVARSQLATRNNINNTPSAEVLERAKLTAEHLLEPIRIHFGIPFVPNSWYRGEAVERKLCWNSFKNWAKKRKLAINEESWEKYFARKSHPKGEAVDIEIPGISNDDLFQWVQDNVPEFDQLIREFPKPGDPKSGWVHVSYRKNDNRKQVFTIG